MPWLRLLDLSQTDVAGSLTVLTDLPDLEKVNLASTAVTGTLTPRWRGRLRHLRHLNLAAQSLVTCCGCSVQTTDLRCGIILQQIQGVTVNKSP